LHRPTLSAMTVPLWSPAFIRIAAPFFTQIVVL
jgi:hypothetical protein